MFSLKRGTIMKGFFYTAEGTDWERIGVGRGGGRGGPGPPIIWEGGQHTLWPPPPNNPPTCTGKTIPLNSILECCIISYFKMRNVIIWHWFIKSLVGTRRRNDVDATLRRIDVVTTSCACWEFGPPLAPPKFLTLAPPNILNLPTPMERDKKRNLSQKTRKSLLIKFILNTHAKK